MEDRKDKDLNSIFNAKDLLAGQGISKRRTAQSAKVAVDLAGVLDKAGTSEGAKRGWETRREGGSADASPKTINLMEDGLRTLVRVARGKDDDVAESAKILLTRGVRGRAQEARRLLDHGMRMADAAARASADGNPPAWAADFSEAIGAYDDEQPEEDKSLNKVGTSEGAKRGWETRRGGATSEEEKPGKKTLGENFLLQPGSGEKFMGDLKAAPVGTTIRDGEGLAQHRKKGDNEWAWLNPTTGQVIMVVDDDSVFQTVRAATTGEAPRKTPAWPSTMHGSPGHKGENWTMQSEKTLDKAGTSEGAKKGWETRRGGGASPEEAGREASFRRLDDSMGGFYSARKEFEAARDKLREVEADPESKKMMGQRVKEEANNKIIAVETAMYESAKVARDEVVGAKGKAWVDEAKREDLERRLRDHAWAGFNADEIDVFESVMNEASALLEPDPKKSLNKVGTSEGARLGWETRRGGGAEEGDRGKPWEHLDPAEEMPGLKDITPEKAYRVEEAITEVEDSLKYVKRSIGTMGHDPESYDNAKSGIDQASKDIDRLLESVKGHLDEGKRQALVDAHKKAKEHYDYYGFAEGHEDMARDLSAISERANRLIDGEDEGEGKAKTMKGSFLTEGE